MNVEYERSTCLSRRKREKSARNQSNGNDEHRHSLWIVKHKKKPIHISARERKNKARESNRTLSIISFCCVDSQHTHTHQTIPQNRRKKLHWNVLLTQTPLNRNEYLMHSICHHPYFMVFSIFLVRFSLCSRCSIVFSKYISICGFAPLSRYACVSNVVTRVHVTTTATHVNFSIFDCQLVELLLLLLVGGGASKIY